MPCVVTCTGVRIQPSGVVLVDWSDGVQDEYASLDALKQAVVVADGNHDGCRLWLLAYYLRRNPDGDQLAALVRNKTLTFDLAAAQPVRVQ